MGTEGSPRGCGALDFWGARRFRATAWVSSVHSDGPLRVLDSPLPRRFSHRTA